MPVEAKPLFRPDVLRAHLAGFALPPHVEAFRPKLAHWANLIASGRIDEHGEQQILADFLADFFVTLLGYTRPADGGLAPVAESRGLAPFPESAEEKVPVPLRHGTPRYTVSRERYVEVDGKFADAVLGDFNGEARFVVALEGKGPRDPLDRLFAGRRMSAVDQGYRYAINYGCSDKACRHRF